MNPMRLLCCSSARDEARNRFRCLRLIALIVAAIPCYSRTIRFFSTFVRDRRFGRHRCPEPDLDIGERKRARGRSVDLELFGFRYRLDLSHCRSSGYGRV